MSSFQKTPLRKQSQETDLKNLSVIYIKDTELISRYLRVSTTR